MLQIIESGETLECEDKQRQHGPQVFLFLTQIYSL